MKTAAVIISGAPSGDNLRELELQAGTSAGDVLRALNLNGYLLSKEGSAQAFAAEEDIYGALADGDKLRATPVAEVGGFWESVLRFFSEAPATGKPAVKQRPAGNGVHVRSSCGQHAGVSGRVSVERDRRSLWELRGWKRSGQRLLGAYRTPRGSYVGEVALVGNHHPQFYIVNPPAGLLKGVHGACFRARGNGKFFVHFGLSNPDVDAGIVAIEKLIAGALSGGRR